MIAWREEHETHPTDLYWKSQKLLVDLKGPSPPGQPPQASFSLWEFRLTRHIKNQRLLVHPSHLPKKKKKKQYKVLNF